MTDQLVADPIATLPVEAVAVVLESIARRGHKWGGKRPLRRRLIAYIGAHPEGVCKSDSRLAVELGCSRGGLVRALRDLRNEGVVVVLLPASGQRPKWIALTAALEDWDVPWVRPVKHVICDAFHEGHQAPAEDPSGSSRAPTGELARDSRRSRAPAAELARDYDGRKFLSRAERGVWRATNDPLSRAKPPLQRATNPDLAHIGSSSSAAGSGRRSVPEDPDFKRLAGALRSAQGWEGLYGNPRQELHRLVDYFGLEAVRESALDPRAPRMANPDHFVLWLGDTVASGGIGATPAPTSPAPATNVVELFAGAELGPEPDAKPGAQAIAEMNALLRRRGSDVTGVGHDGDELDLVEGDEP